jgi:hypothetical protein
VCKTWPGGHFQEGTCTSPPLPRAAAPRRAAPMAQEYPPAEHDYHTHGHAALASVWAHDERYKARQRLSDPAHGCPAIAALKRNEPAVLAALLATRDAAQYGAAAARRRAGPVQRTGPCCMLTADGVTPPRGRSARGRRQPLAAAAVGGRAGHDREPAGAAAGARHFIHCSGRKP